MNEAPARDISPEPEVVRPESVAPQAPVTENESPLNTSSPNPSPEPEECSPWGLRRGDQVVVAVLISLGLVFLTLHAWRMGGFRGEMVDIDRLPETQSRYRLDVNQATWVEWAQLDGIGETLARRIVADREANGPFHSAEDLLRVKGIGPRTLERIRPWLRVDESRPASRR